MESTFEFEIQIQQAAEMVRDGKRVEALRFLKSCMTKMEQQLTWRKNDNLLSVSVYLFVIEQINVWI